MSEYSMPSYFQTMPVIGKEVAHFSDCLLYTSDAADD